ncbi:hypothetical protein HaLaN_17372 [Haematococcus lacustris]|uniref:Uncharacterized protein n=1 Tax=Haematococcus lacustris TaxID=44745 RepID=A0A699ZL26_HAELA|nr:hypothetical protein HaLaN_17372 [Haematococcus lacustris]
MLDSDDCKRRVRPRRECAASDVSDEESPWAPKARYALQTHFGFGTFRGHQEAAICAALEGGHFRRTSGHTLTLQTGGHQHCVTRGRGRHNLVSQPAIDELGRVFRA